MKPAARLDPDLLAWDPLRRAVLWRGFPVVPQTLILITLLLLIAAGFGIGRDAAAGELMVLRKTNLATLVVWGLWWPAMIAMALGCGRAWCTVCPLELVNRLGYASGRRLGIRRPALNRTLRAGWLGVALYLLLQILVAGFAIHRVPHYTAVFLLSLLGLAMSTGIVFREPRSFCRAFCPSAALLSVYGRFTPVQLEMRNSSVCVACTTRDCVVAENRHRFDRRSCPSLLLPYDRDPSSGCVLCLQCAKVCPHDNVGLGPVAADSPIRRRIPLRPHEAAFVMLALGFVAHEVVGEVPWLDGLFHAVPDQLAGLSRTESEGWWEALWFLLLFPAGIWLVIAGLARLAGHRGSLSSLLLAAATGAAPVVATAHLAKASAKVVTWLGYLPLSIGDPRGIETMRLIGNGSLAAPGSRLGLPAIGWVMLLSELLVVAGVWRWVGDMNSGSKPAMRAGLAGATLLFSFALACWSLSNP